MPISFHIASGAVPREIGPWKSFGLDPAKMSQGSAATRGTQQMAPVPVSASVDIMLSSHIMINIIYSGLLDLNAAVGFWNMMARDLNGLQIDLEPERRP
jgi:hypothetical protein